MQLNLSSADRDTESLEFISVNEVIRVENSTGPNALRDFQLSDEILPKPKTKVTTTVR